MLQLFRFTTSSAARLLRERSSCHQSDPICARNTGLSDLTTREATLSLREDDTDTNDNEQRARIENFLNSEHLTYQKIRLGAHVSTPGLDRTSIDHILFADQLEGESILDVGSAQGRFCIEALRRGAASATGLETSPERIRHARRIAEILDVRPRPIYLHEDVEHWTAPAKSFDRVLCLNVLHHLYDPISVLRKLMFIARKRLYLEIAPVNTKGIFKVTSFFTSWLASNAPVIVLGNPKDTRRTADGAFILTPKTLSIIINGHTQAFEPVIIHRSSFKNRFVIEARRRQINHLVVVAGVTSVGKSTFIERLKSPELRQRFGIADRYVTFFCHDEFDKLAKGPIETLVFHYDLLRPFDRPLQSHGRDPALTLLSSAEKITLITLFNSAEELAKRKLKELAKLKPERTALRKLKELAKSKLKHETKVALTRRGNILLRMYRNSKFLDSWYDAWFEEMQKYASSTISSLRVRTNDSYDIVADRNEFHRILHEGSRSPTRHAY